MLFGKAHNINDALLHNHAVIVHKVNSASNNSRCIDLHEHGLNISFTYAAEYAQAKS